MAVSLQLHHLTVTAFIATPTNNNILMRCGRADIGTIRGDIGLREPEEAMANRQFEFLKRADSRTHRLWFIWNRQYNCGCCGGCQFLSSSITRVPTPIIHDQLKNLPQEPIRGPSPPSATPPLATPSQSSFKSLVTLQYLHSTMYHFLADDQQISDTPLEETPGHLPSTSSLPSVIPEDDILSQESDNDSFHSANEYFGNEDPNEELYHSTTNTPRASIKHHSRQSSKHSVPTGLPLNTDTFKRSRNYNPVIPPTKKCGFVSDYVKVLNSYKCSWKTIKLYKRGGVKESPPTESKSGSGLRFMGGVTPKRAKRRDPSKYILEVPIFTNALDQLPYIVHSHLVDNRPLDTNRNRRSSVTDNSAMFSVEVGITGFDVFLSPPLIPLIERFVHVYM